MVAKSFVQLKVPTDPGAALEVGTQQYIVAGLAGKQDGNANLGTIGGLDTVSPGTLATDGAGWIRKTYAQLKTALALVKGDVGLGNVDNTSDATKNAAAVTLTNKTLTAPAISSPTGLVKGDVGLGSVDNTADTAKPVSSAQQTALNLKAPLASPTFTGVATFERTVRGAYALGATLTGTVAINGNNGDLQRGTATGAVTIGEPTNGTDGQMILIEITASGADRVVTVHTDITRYSGCAASITCLSGKKALLGLMRSGADWYATTLDRVP